MVDAPRVSQRSRMRQFFRVALRYWSGRTRWRAWALTVTVLVFIAAQTAAAVGINRWNRWFFDALEKRVIKGAGLDVFRNEPGIDPRFLALDNVVLQPHHASGTVETRKAMGQLVRDNLAAHFAGQPLVTPVV